MIWVLAGVVVLVSGLAAYVRLAPVDPARWHVDPLSAVSPGKAGWLVRPVAGDVPGPVFQGTPEDVLVALDTIALATPRTRRIAGSLAEGRITYLTRSRLWGFPDFTTVAAIPVEGGAAPAVFARLWFGGSDMGVNRARVERWERALRNALPEAG